MKNFILRTVVGVAYVALLVGSLVMGPEWACFFFGIVTWGTIYELCSVLNRHGGLHTLGLLSATAGFILVAFSWLCGFGDGDMLHWLALYILLLLAMPIVGLYRRTGTSVQDWMAMLTSQLYVAFPFAMLPTLAVVRPSSYCYNWYMPLALFVFIWINDTGAYLVGSALHRYLPWKLFPSVSPGKSWVGSIGGGIATLLASVVCWYFDWYFDDTCLKLPVWIGFAMVVVVAGTLGDLVESQLKRQMNIKDSSHILPGHGGLLDRFDSSLLAIPASVCYFFLLS